MLFYISLPSSSNINTLRTTVHIERFSVVRADRWVQTPGHLCYMGCLCPSWSSGQGPERALPRPRTHASVSCTRHI